MIPTAAGNNPNSVPDVLRVTWAGQTGVVIPAGKLAPLNDALHVDVLAGQNLSVISSVEVAAAVASGTAGANNGITWQVATRGAAGANITFVLVTPGTANAALSVTVTGVRSQ